MCIGKPECQNCETCGNRKYQFWATPEDMHDRGCPFGYDRMDHCPDAINHAKLLFWSRKNGVAMTAQGMAKVDQLLAAGIDLSAPPVDFDPVSDADAP
jgi:hypothetical protein